MDRVKTGIPGLDEMTEGGIKRNTNVLVSGGCGSGKSTFCMQYLYYGAQNNEPGVYITFEEYPEAIKDNMMRYGWDLDGLEKKGMMRIVRIDPNEVMHVIKENYGIIVDSIKDINAKRVVLDSLSSIETMIETDYDRRRTILDILSWLRGNNCTSMLIGEAEQDPNQYSRHGVMEFSVDAVIVMYNIRRESARHRAIEILKMRGTNHMNKIVPFMMGPGGIELLPKQKLFGVV